MLRVWSGLEKFGNDCHGAVAMIFGLSFVVLCLMVGLAVDTSRAFNAEAKIQTALDAAALAAARYLDMQDVTDEAVSERARLYFEARLPSLNIDHATASNFHIDIDRANSGVEAFVDVNVPTLLAEVGGGLVDFTFTPSSKVIFKSKKIELALVLDITGSMCDVPPAVSDPACPEGVKIRALKEAAKSMIDALFDANPDPGAVKVSLVPYSASVNAGPYAAAASAGASSDNCVVERSGAAANTNASVATGGPAGTSDTGTALYYSCPPTPVTPLTDLSALTDRDAFKAAIENLAAKGGTAGHIGAAWGWYTISPAWNSLWPARPARAYDPSNVLKVVVLMTDGMFNVAYANGGETHAWPDVSSTDPTLAGTSANQALALCDAMKNPANAGEAVSIYTVGFQAPLEAEAILKQCSGESNFYDTSNASQLTNAFKDIVEKLTSLRITS